MRVMLLTVTMIAALTCIGTASDGVIEINQARALEGGVTDGDTPGFPVTISQSGSYRLTGNLTVPGPGSVGGGGIRVLTGGVTIDLNGFSIASVPVSTSTIGVLLDVGNGSAVVNGVVTGFNLGIATGGNANGTRVERVRVSDVADIGIHILAHDGLVSGCTVLNARGAGIALHSGLAIGNVVSGSGTGLVMGEDAGYVNNVFRSNVTNVMLGAGTSLGANLCGARLCQ